MGWLAREFKNGLKAPHVMAAPPSHPDGPRIVQFISLDWSAYALFNAEGGVETNRLGALQVEVVGFAKDSPASPTMTSPGSGEKLSVQ